MFNGSTITTSYQNDRTMPPSITAQDSLIAFANDDAIFKVAQTGHSVGLKVLGNGQELYPCDGSGSNSFALVYFSTPSGNKSSDSNKIFYTPLSDGEGILEVRFPDPIKIFIRCKAEPDHFVFTLEQVQDFGTVNSSVIAVAMLQMIFPCDAYGGLMPALLKGDYLISQIPLDADSHVHSTPMSNDASMYAMLTAGFAAVKLEGVKTALVVCHKNQWLNRMQALAEKYNLPHPTIQGIWDKKHPDVKGSYFFVDIDLQNRNDVIQYAKLGRFRHVMPYVSTWAENIGSYCINQSHYDGKLDKLKDVAEAVRAKGMKFGLHVMAFMVGKTDPIIKKDWVKKLAKNPETLLLSQNIGEKEFVLPVNNPFEFQKFITAGEKYLLLGTEILLLESIQNDPPGLVVMSEMVDGEQIRKSPVGTTPMKHSAGAVIYHLPEFFDAFLADPNTDLPDYIAQNFANVYKHIGADFAYLDGAEGTRVLLPPNMPWADGWYWHASAQVANKYRAALGETDALLQSSAVHENVGYSWFAYSRGNSGDYAANAVEAWMDHYRIGRYRNKVYAHAAFPQELGWIALLSRVDGKRARNASFSTTTPDEIEYQMNRALGFDLPISLESTAEEILKNKLADEIFAMIGKYERLRLYFQITDELKQKLQGANPPLVPQEGFLKEQYHLVRFWPTGQCTFRRQIYLERVMSFGQEWSFNNPFHAQSLKMKITALPGHQAFAESGNELIFDVMDEETFGQIGRGAGIAPKKPDEIDNVRIKDARVIVEDIVANSLASTKWCSFRKEFDSHVDLSKHKGIELTADGDSKGEVVCLQLFDDQGMQRLFQFAVDFSGVRQIAFELPTAAAFYDYQPPISIGGLFRYFNWSCVKGVEIHIKNILCPISIKISSVKALKQDCSKLKNPEIELSGKKITFPAVLNPRDEALKAEPWDYLVSNGKLFSRYNGNHQRYSTGVGIPILSPSPKLKSGSNTLVYRHEGSNKALVRIILEGNDESWLCQKKQ